MMLEILSNIDGSCKTDQLSWGVRRREATYSFPFNSAGLHVEGPREGRYLQIKEKVGNYYAINFELTYEHKEKTKAFQSFVMN